MDENKQEADAGLASIKIVAAMNQSQFASFLSLVEQVQSTISEYDRDHLTVTDFLSLVYCEAGDRGNATYKEYARADDDDDDNRPGDGGSLGVSNIIPLWTKARPMEQSLE